MPASPDMAREVARQVRAVYERAEWLALERIVQAVAKGIDAPDWEVQNQADLADVLATLDRYMARLDDTAPALFERAVARAYQDGTKAARLDLEAAGVGRTPLGGPRASRAVQALVEDNVAALSGARPRVLRATRDVFLTVTQETTAQVLTGQWSRRDAARQALRRYADRSVTTFTDQSGRRWSLPSYAEMAARTTTGQAAVQGHTDQLRDLGQDLVKVSTSPESCSECGKWQGRVLSLTGATTGRLKDGVTVAGTLDYARSQGFQHPNCTHTVGLYLPGYSRRAEAAPADPAVYETRQRQRAFERSVRHHKRAALIDAETLGPKSPQAVASRRRLRTRQAEFKAWRDDHGRKDLGYRTSLTAR